MHPIRKRRLVTALILLIGIGLASGIALFALSNNINLYVTPQQLKHQHIHLGQSIRLGGMVVKGSVHRQGPQQIEFALTDFHRTVRVRYRGLLPSLFREGQGIVAAGYLQTPGIFQANRVLAKHDATYHPPHVPRD